MSPELRRIKRNMFAVFLFFLGVLARRKFTPYTLSRWQWKVRN